MSERYPRIRIHAENGHLLIRDGLNLTFYMRRDHAEVAPGVMRSLESYRRAIEPTALGLYADEEGYWHKLDDAGWERTRREMLANSRLEFHLLDASSDKQRYRFDYFGKALDDPFSPNAGELVSTVSFWLPTEYIQEHGSQRLRELALELAAPLPLCSGHVGLSFNCETDLVGVRREIRKRCFRYPGMDIPDPSQTSQQLGTRIRGASWLTFLGQPLLGALGGASTLRARLHSPEVTVQELEGDRALITLGPWPEAGDTEQGLVLPSYRELARVLEPWLYHQKPLRDPDFTPEDMHRWERRFLD